MVGPVRGFSAPPHSVRFPSFLASCIAIVGGLLAATCAGAASSDWLAADASQAGSDSVAVAGIPTQTRATPTLARPNTDAYTIHLHGGMFSPIEVNATSPTLGLRLGRRMGAHLQGGLLVGWTFERKNLEQPVNGLPGLQPQLILARADGHLVPAMVFLEVNLTDTRFLVPYAGIATGYEWFFLRANDFRTGETASATFSNWAWESWGGIGMRLDQKLRVDFELFYNGGSLEREVVDSSGQVWREAVNVNGVGARVGVGIPF